MAAVSPERKKKRVQLFSPTKTIQCDDTCRFHTISRMIIHLVFDELLPMNHKELGQYSECMPLTTPMTDNFSIERCSENGFLKIMLFYYFFYLSKKLDLPSIKGDRIQELLKMPPIDEVDIRLFDHLRDRINKNVFGYHIQLDDSELFPEILERAIKPILRLGVYLELGLQPIIEESDEEDEEAFNPGHIVLIVAADEYNISIKNSWDDFINHVPFEEVIELEEDSFRTDDIFFVIPNDFGKYEYDNRDMDELYSYLNPKGGKKRKTKYGQRRNHHKSKVIRASRKRTKTYNKRRLFKH